jgi:TetR/AcrR family transcriptional regulator
MKTRAQQREETRERIVQAAVECFSETGFRGASTREIANRAGANQGLITYHFRTKEELWKAAADRLFGLLRKRLGEHLAGLDSEDPRTRARETLREYVRFSAAHPELFRFMVEQGNSDGARMQWLVDTHLKPLYQGFPRLGVAEGTLRPHAYYAVAGAGSIVFAVAPECRRLTGLDPSTPEAVETHADFVARLLVPD